MLQTVIRDTQTDRTALIPKNLDNMELPMRHQNLVRLSLAALAATALPTVAVAQAESLGTTAEEFEAKLGYQSGAVTIKDGLAHLNVPPSFRFLGEEGSKRLLVKGWGNPEKETEGVLGMLVPANVSPFADSGWAVVISYDEDGYVDDKGAESINYTELLKQMQAGVQEANKEREKQGYEPVTLVGWAEPPTYNRDTHKLYWAKELQFSNSSHTLNYNVRVLGRRGVLVLNAVSGMDQLEPVKAGMAEVISFVEFGEGHKYTDFVAGTDKVATYGVAGLVAGALATKAGLFKVLLAGLLAAKKLIVVAFVAAAAWAKKLWAKLKGDKAAATTVT
jgi:uncharacterized membrane-anchored protein